MKWGEPEDALPEPEHVTGLASVFSRSNHLKLVAYCLLSFELLLLALFRSGRDDGLAKPVVRVAIPRGVLDA